MKHVKLCKSISCKKCRNDIDNALYECPLCGQPPRFSKRWKDNYLPYKRMHPDEIKFSSYEEFLEFHKKCTYLNSWTKPKQISDVYYNYPMWNIYGKSHDSIAICTTIGALTETFELHENYDKDYECYVENVCYKVHEKGSRPDPGKKGDYGLFLPYFQKSPLYQFENETRIILHINDDCHKEEKSKSISVNPQKLIQGIIICPLATPEFYKMIKDIITKRYNLNKDLILNTKIT